MTQYDNMTGPQLVATYNDLITQVPDAAARPKPVKKFADHKTAVKRVAELQEKLKSYVGAPDGHAAPDGAAPQAKKKKEKKDGSAKTPRHAHKVVALKPANPKKPGSLGAIHYDAMVKAGTVGAYLARYDDPKSRQTASQWLANFVKEGHVKVEAP